MLETIQQLSGFLGKRGMKAILSVSRRTDIPAFYTEWFLNRLKAGYVYITHPYTRKWRKVSLKPEDLGVIVFWSKNYSPLLKQIEQIEKRISNLFFHFTITGNAALELNVPSYTETVKDFIFISKRYSSRHIIWRFDPICITNKLSFCYYEDKFIKCAEQLQGYTQACYISFINLYKKVFTNFKKYTDQKIVEVNLAEKREFVYKLANIAEKYNIRLYVCCNDCFLCEKVDKGSCINGHYLARLFQLPLEVKSAATRKECACTKSVDIGSYDTCIHGCLYCYANTNKEKAESFYKNFSPDWNSLEGNVNLKELKEKSYVVHRATLL